MSAAADDKTLRVRDAERRKLIQIGRRQATLNLLEQGFGNGKVARGRRKDMSFHPGMAGDNFSKSRLMFFRRHQTIFLDFHHDPFASFY
jgi:hypothetical protein